MLPSISVAQTVTEIQGLIGCLLLKNAHWEFSLYTNITFVCTQLKEAKTKRWMEILRLVYENESVKQSAVSNSFEKLFPGR